MGRMLEARVPSIIYLARSRSGRRYDGLRWPMPWVLLYRLPRHTYPRRSVLVTYLYLGRLYS